VTTVYVTHDQVEAMTLGQRVAVMRDGRIQQVDSPQNLYQEPANLFVAAFIGSPSMNLVEATVSDGTVEFAGFKLPLASERRPTRDGQVILGIRPESFEDAAFAERSLPRLDAQVSVLEELGSDAHVIFPVDAPRVSAEDLDAAADEPMEGLMADDLRSLFNARVDTRTSATTGRPLTLAVDPAQFHFFDPETGTTLRAEAAVVAAAE
jgi:multiple sugar transport system ATP-binding protein